jgi:hypothetical protein
MSTALPVTAPKVADTVILPGSNAKIDPLFEKTVPRFVSEVSHFTPLSGFELPSEYFAVAMYCWVWPASTVALAGDTVIDTSVGLAGGFLSFPPPHDTSSQKTQNSEAAIDPPERGKVLLGMLFAQLSNEIRPLAFQSNTATIWVEEFSVGSWSRK